MICANCQMTLPEEAVACWKCGTPIAAPAAQAAAPKRPVDPLLLILTLLISVGVFVCLGWAIPFTIWGLITSSAKQYPEWSGILDIVSGAAFVLSALGFFGGTWWASYQVLQRLTAKPGS